MKGIKYRVLYFACFMVLFSAVLLFAKTDSNAVTGTWLTADGKAKIGIFRSGDKFHGKIVWLKDPNEEDGKQKVDKNNPNAKLRSRPLLGLILIRDFVYDADDEEWDDGYIYDPQSGKTYSSYMKLDSNDKLTVRGYIGFSLIGRSQIWTRVR